MRVSRGALRSAQTLRWSAGSEAQSLHQRCWSSVVARKIHDAKLLHSRCSRPLLTESATVLSRGGNTVRSFLKESAKIESSIETGPAKLQSKAIPPSFAFAFDIDGVLLHVSKPIPGATETLKYLQNNNIPFILLTNGGGKSEAERVVDLSDKLGVELSTDNFVQSHTPFKQFKHLKDKTILVTGSNAGKARRIAQGYGFESVVTPGDILKACPEIFPFDHLSSFYDSQEILPLSKPIYNPNAPNPMDLEDCLKIDAIFVYNDPRDWAVDIQIITDILRSSKGYLGTYAKPSAYIPKDCKTRDQDPDGSQPELWFSNSDMLWSTTHHDPRFGQGAFQAALRGVWTMASQRSWSSLNVRKMGKPGLATYKFAQAVLEEHRFRTVQRLGAEDPSSQHSQVTEAASARAIKTVYMVGDNPASDIAGANNYGKMSLQTYKADWISVLVRTGVWNAERDGDNFSPMEKPRAIVDDVKAAVDWALKREAKETQREAA